MQFDKQKYNVWTWKHPLILHWIINPGLAINELVFGQRIPKLCLIEKESKRSLSERTYVPCSHCNTLHSGLKWSFKNNTAFGNWFGYYCDNCGKTIPCVRNLTSFIILTVTFPIWYWFKDNLKSRWLDWQRRRFSKPMDLSVKYEQWWMMGLKWGLIMFILMSFVNFLFFKDHFTWASLASYAVAWIIGGLIFGLIMKRYNIRSLDS